MFDQPRRIETQRFAGFNLFKHFLVDLGLGRRFVGPRLK